MRNSGSGRITDSDIEKARAEVEWLLKTEPVVDWFCWLSLFFGAILLIAGACKVVAESDCWSKL